MVSDLHIALFLAKELNAAGDDELTELISAHITLLWKIFSLVCNHLQIKSFHKVSVLMSCLEKDTYSPNRGSRMTHVYPTAPIWHI